MSNIIFIDAFLEKKLVHKNELLQRHLSWCGHYIIKAQEMHDMNMVAMAQKHATLACEVNEEIKQLEVLLHGKKHKSTA